MVGTLKRTVTLEGNKRPTKVPRTITSKLNKLSRQVNAQKPEVRQDGYAITVPAATVAPTPLINIASMTALEGDASEIRLHRIRVAYAYTATDPLWGIMYSAKGSNSLANSIDPLFFGGNPYDITNYLVPPDPSKAIVYKNLNFSGNNKINNTHTGQVIVFDQRFSIPKKIMFNKENNIAGAEVTNQIFYIGGNRSGAASRTMYVTLWYTS